MAKSRILLVEGQDDKHVVWALAQHAELPEVFEVSDKDGIDALLEMLPAQLKASGLEVLGIMVDADTNMQARWQSLRDILTKSGYKVPKQPSLEGTIMSMEDKPTVGIWLMPDNQRTGMLEDFAADLISDDDLLLPYARTSVAQLPERRYPDVQRAKAELHTWLAWQKEPGKPIGLAITAKYLNPASEQAQPFVNWLRTLFQIS
jgi:hypothetical protein